MKNNEICIKSKVSILGYGNVGKSLVHSLSEKFEVNILTLSDSNKEKKLITKFGQKICNNELNCVYKDIKKGLQNTDVLIITVPNFLKEEIVKKILPFLTNQIIIFIPGIGASQFITKKYLNGFKVFCLERVPYIARFENGIEHILDDRKIIKYASINPEDNIDELIQLMFNKPVKKIPYAQVTLTTSNAILHPTRMFALFKDAEEKAFNQEIYFYTDWDNKSSKIFQKCDNEVVEICNELNRLGIIDERIISLMKYYESETPEQLTKKIKSIPAFSKIKLKMLKKDDNQYMLDKNDRFLTEDIPYGLLMFKGIAEILNIKTPNIDMIINWGQKVLNKNYIKNGKLFEYLNTGCPQNFGIFTKEELKLSLK